MTQILNLIKWLLILLIIFALAFLIYALVKINQPLTTTTSDKVFTVPAGLTSGQVAESLEEEGLISKAFFFKLYIYFKKQDDKIQAGNYVLSTSMSIREIAEALVSGDALSDQIKFTAIEGWTADDIAESLEKNGITKKRDFLRLSTADFASEFEFLKNLPAKHASLEGFLFPDTYLFDKDSPPEAVAYKMLLNFDRKLTAQIRQEIEVQRKTFFGIVTLASIVEKEVGRNVKEGEKLTFQDLAKLREERRLVASVFYNRLKIGKPLESDATVTYITGSRSSRASLEETKIDSPYNTYKYQGLPPGPISNPSLDSIMAAVSPAESDYLYFLTAPDGTAYFARTFEEHQQNRARYLE
ncbi:MAG: endolytic transglycosylase MltG [Candidatus Doudnabacteria bacterium]|nr:endolytic transglycosylase MltG [Candidatus Doudnabacteria bacterium]